MLLPIIFISVSRLVYGDAAEDCIVPYIPHGNIEEQVQGPEKYNWWRVQWERKITYNKIQVGFIPSKTATLFLVCEKDHLVSGLRLSRIQVTCSDGKWSRDLVCVKSFCKLPQSPNHGSLLLVGDIKVGSLALYTCNDDRVLVGASASKCLSTGEWTSPPPKCLGLTCPQAKKSGNITVKYTNKRRVGSKATFRCIAPLVLVGESTLQCLRTENWNHPPPTCQNLTCPQITVTEGMRVKYANSWIVGISATFNCLTPFRIVGESLLRCLSTGKWNHPQPICQKREVLCPQLEETDIIAVHFSNGRKVNSTAYVRCKEGSLGIAGGVNNRICLPSGEWSGANPDCLVSHCLIWDFVDTAPENVLLNLEGVTEVLQPIGSELSMLCDDGWVLIGDKKTKCGPLGKWNYGETQCVLGCHINAKKENSSLMIHPFKEYYRFGEFATLSCPPGLELTSDVERVMCMGNEWSQPIPDCQIAIEIE